MCLQSNGCGGHNLYESVIITDQEGFLKVKHYGKMESDLFLIIVLFNQTLIFFFKYYRRY